MCISSAATIVKAEKSEKINKGAEIYPPGLQKNSGI